MFRGEYYDIYIHQKGGARWADHYVNVSIEIVLSWMLFTEDESLSNYWHWTVETEQLALSDTNILLPTN